MKFNFNGLNQSAQWFFIDVENLFSITASSPAVELTTTNSVVVRSDIIQTATYYLGHTIDGTLLVSANSDTIHFSPLTIRREVPVLG